MPLSKEAAGAVGEAHPAILATKACEDNRMRIHYKIQSILMHSRPQNHILQSTDGAWPLSIPPKEPRALARVGSILFLCLLFILPVAFAKNNGALKSEVYSKLKCCACRESFDKCSCPEAEEIKAYINAFLESGAGKEEIFYQVAKKFSLNIILDEQIKKDIEKKLIQEAGQNRPQAFIDPASYNFGRVSKKQGKVSKSFKLSNQGNLPLVIKNLKTSCPCATVLLKVNKKKSPYFGTDGAPGNWQIEIRPAEFGELQLGIDLASPHVEPGKLIREALIFSNDPVYPELKVMVEAEVTE